MSRTPDFYRRDSAGDPAEAAAVPSRAHGRARRLTVTAVVAGGLVPGGTAIAYADGTTAPTTSSSTSPSQPSNGSPAPTQRPAPRPHIDGTVASVSGDTVTVTDHDGFARTIVTSTATTYAGGLSAPLAVGTEIHATGTVDANHTSLDATQIGTRPTPPAGARGKDGPRPPMPPAEGGPGPGQDGRQHAGPVRPVAPAAPGGSTPAPSTTGGS